MNILTRIQRAIEGRSLAKAIVHQRPDLSQHSGKDLLELFIEESVADLVEAGQTQNPLPPLVQRAVDYIFTETDRHYHARALLAEQENKRLRILIEQSHKAMAEFEQMANHCLDIAQDATGSRPSLN